MICFQGHATNIHQTLTRYHPSVKQSMQVNLKHQDGAEEEGRILGLAMVPGHHVTRSAWERLGFGCVTLKITESLYWTLFMMVCTHIVDQFCTGCGSTRSLQEQLRDHLPLLRATQATPATQTSLLQPFPYKSNFPQLRATLGLQTNMILGINCD